MDADLDTLRIAVSCTIDDLLSTARANPRRRVGDAELVTVCVAQRFPCLAACVWLNHQLGRPSRSRVADVARARGINHL